MAAYSEIIIEQYASFSTTINIQDTQGDALNISGYTAASQMRKSPYASSAESFNVVISNISTGELTISMASANTANLSPGRYLYDVKITSPTNDVIRVVEGIVTVTPGITH